MSIYVRLIHINNSISAPDLDKQYDMHRHFEMLLDKDGVDKFQPQLSQIFKLYKSYEWEGKNGKTYAGRVEQYKQTLTNALNHDQNAATTCHKDS